MPTVSGRHFRGLIGKARLWSAGGVGFDRVARGRLGAIMVQYGGGAVRGCRRRVAYPLMYQPCPAPRSNLDDIAYRPISGSEVESSRVPVFRHYVFARRRRQHRLARCQVAC